MDAGAGSGHGSAAKIHFVKQLYMYKSNVLATITQLFHTRACLLNIMQQI